MTLSPGATASKQKMGCFLVLQKLLLVRFCVVVWVLFSVFSIFCITSLVSATPRNHQKMQNIVMAIVEFSVDNTVCGPPQKKKNVVMIKKKLLSLVKFTCPLLMKLIWTNGRHDSGTTISPDRDSGWCSICQANIFTIVSFYCVKFVVLLSEG